jgi:uncharacterized protein
MKAFECKKCGACCYGRGGILVNEQETRDIAAFLCISLEAFIKAYCETRNGKRYVQSRQDGYCVFFDRERLCRIHPVKPRPCRLWPFYPALLKDKGSWKAAMDACPGINPNVSHEDFVKEAQA